LSGVGVSATAVNSSATALEIVGNIKVSGGNRAAFVHTTTAGNTSGYITVLSYANEQPNDLIFFAHRWVGSYMNGKALGTWWNGSAWTIYVEDPTVTIPNGEQFAVLVIRQ
jgi:hypothetical protein